MFSRPTPLIFQVEEIFNSDNLFTLLVQSICPSIYGHDVILSLLPSPPPLTSVHLTPFSEENKCRSSTQLVKAGLLLALFGGTDRNMGADKDKMAVRGDPHVLIVGDPG
jgi:DNA helicase MCM8